MAEKRIGIIMNDVTGRMGHNQHLVRSIIAIRQQGGVRLLDGSRLMPDPILVGRDEQKLREIALAQGLERWSTDLDRALNDTNDAVYFDAQLTATRAPAVEKAIAYRQLRILRCVPVLGRLHRTLFPDRFPLPSRDQAKSLEQIEECFASQS